MPTYKRPEELEEAPHPAFDVIYSPGERAPYSGIYKCVGCGWEVTSSRIDALPLDHPHVPAMGTIRWRLSVARNGEVQ